MISSAPSLPDLVQASAIPGELADLVNVAPSATSFDIKGDVASPSFT